MKKDHPHSEETRRKISEATRGRAGSFKGRQHTPEAIEKIRVAQTGKKKSAEAREKMRQSALGRTLSEETKAKMSAAKLGKPRSAEARAAISAGHAARFGKNEGSSPN